MNTYPDDWDTIAWYIKHMAGWRCENCNHPHNRPTGHVLTVHHLNGDKADCSPENLVALCQRCHLSIQAKYRPGQMTLQGIEAPEWMKKRGLA